MALAVPDDPARGLTAKADRADVDRVLGGDAEAFASIVTRHQGRIIAHCRRMIGPSHAEDVAQETFLRAYRALDRYDPAYPLRGWLLVIATRLAAQQRSRWGAEAMPHEPAAAGCDPAEAVARDDDHAVLVRRLEAAVAALPAESRDLYELRFRQELSPAELAAHFGLTVNAVTVRLHRLRAVLAARLEVSHEY
jgi:RNA polymerase sigma-70 factor (ECF subfamily)